MPPGRVNPKSAAEWSAVLPVYVGLAGLVACFVVWVIFNRVEPLLLGAFGTLIAAGQGADVIAALRSGPPQPAPEPEKEP
jgi:hypothetical protein